MVAAYLNQVDAILRQPKAFLIGEEKRSVGIETDAVGSAKAGGENIRARAVRADPQKGPMVRHQGFKSMPGGPGVVEIPFRIRLEAHGEFMEVIRHLMVIVEVLVKIN